MPRNSNYDKYPCIPIHGSGSECSMGWRDIISRLKETLRENRSVLCVECYPGAFENSIREALEKGLRADRVIYAPDLLKPASEVDRMRSEEHTSELQSQSNLVCRLLLEKK